MAMHSNTKTLTLALLAMTAIASADTATKKIFLPIQGADQLTWSASVVGACSDSTTYALRCSGTPTLGPSIAALSASNAAQSGVIGVFMSAVSHQCDSSQPPRTITEGPSGFLETTSTMISGATLVAENSCAITDVSSADCTYSWSANKGSTHTASVNPPVAYTGAQFPLVDVAVTGGSQKFAAATDTACPNSATSQFVPIMLPAAMFVSVLGAVLAL